jgi:hypothetical protein
MAEILTCPFCGAPWTAAMLEQLEQQSSGAFCACCVGRYTPQHVAGPLRLPIQDLCCETCSKPIYRAPAARTRND